MGKQKSRTRRSRGAFAVKGGPNNLAACLSYLADSVRSRFRARDRGLGLSATARRLRKYLCLLDIRMLLWFFCISYHYHPYFDLVARCEIPFCVCDFLRFCIIIPQEAHHGRCAMWPVQRASELPEACVCRPDSPAGPVGISAVISSSSYNRYSVS